MIYDFMNAIFGCKVHKAREKWACKYYTTYYPKKNWRCIFNLSLENNNLIISTDIMHKTIDYDYRNAIYSS